MKLGRAARKQLAELIAGATSLQGDFFRSVAFRYFHPDDVISGEGTRLNGGRFVPAGVRAVYASLEEETAMREVTTRKTALSGRNQIDVGEYPRMTYVLSVTTHRNLDLASTLPSELASIVGLCLGGRGYSASQELAGIWIAKGVESVVFPSATGVGRNVAVYLANAGAGSVVDLHEAKGFLRGGMGRGSVHHVAFRAKDDAAQAEMAAQLRDKRGLQTTEQKDRQYFRSVYFREPGGILFEIATDDPGFTIDEPAATLGRDLKLPRFLEPHRHDIEAVLPPLKEAA